MKLSIAICTHNEGHYVSELLQRLTLAVATSTDCHEIVIIDDNSWDAQTVNALTHVHPLPFVKIANHALNGDYATHKNYMNSLCTGDWILNLDADEWIPDNVIELIPHIVESNPDIEAYWIPRINTVDGLTLKHVQQWRWTLSTLPGFRTAKEIPSNSDEYQLLKGYGMIVEERDGFVIYDQPIVCWPDPQMRLYKNDPKIKWEGVVHERLTGFEHFSMFPYEVDYAIRHFKEIGRQEAQNSYYETLQK